jgi:hypothetical protein
MGGSIGQQLESQCLEGISGKDGSRLAECDMAGGFAPAGVIIVHGGEVIMDEGIGVQAFESGRSSQAIDLGDIEHGCGLDQQKGAKALAGTQQGIAHRFEQSGCRDRVRQQLIQAALHRHSALAQSLWKIHVRQRLAPLKTGCDKGQPRQS